MPVSLFSQPDTFARRGLELLDTVLDGIVPMTGRQKRDLPMACRELSARLTTDRSTLGRPYWLSPRLTSAYLRYFLPWNLVRLTALLPSLTLENIPEKPLILDMGSGPLTLPLALWLARPDLRTRPVTLVASDVSPHILDIGKRIFESLCGHLAPDTPAWTIRTLRTPAAQALHRLYATPGDLWLICMCNVLNEMEDRHAHPGSNMAARMRELLEDASSMLCQDGLLLSVEPGTRQGGRLVAHLRKNALNGENSPEYENLTDLALREEQETQVSFFPHDGDYEGDEEDFLPPLFQPLAPCPHVKDCPMLGRRVTAWCHFNVPAAHAPRKLRELSSRAGLDKDSVSLSFLLLKKIQEEAALRSPRPSRKIPARIISDAFTVPGYPGRARYACTEAGLALLPDAAALPAGGFCEGFVTRERDEKSGAFILSPREPYQTASRHRPHPLPSRTGRRKTQGRFYQ